jgi:hypothetical protein
MNTIFGQVIEGQDLVEKIADAPVNANGKVHRPVPPRLSLNLGFAAGKEVRWHEQRGRPEFGTR